MLARVNPFSSDRLLRVRHRLTGLAWPDLLSRLRQMNYRAALVGPKGSGKTTLLEDLEPKLAELGFRPKPLRLDEQHRQFAPDFLRQFFARFGPSEIILLDGAEQMSWWQWRRFCARSRGGAGLVITSHRPGLLPTLHECRTSPELLREIITQLLGQEAAPGSDECQTLFERHHGDIRLALRELYDQFARRPGYGAAGQGSLRTR